MKSKKTIQERFAKGRATLDEFGRDDTVWKPCIANAVLELLAETGAVTAETVLARVEAMASGPMFIGRAKLSEQTTKLASETATARLLEAIAKHHGEGEQRP